MPNDMSLNVDREIKRLTEEALTKTGNNRTTASALLGISLRTLRNWINKYKLAEAYPPAPRPKKRK